MIHSRTSSKLSSRPILSNAQPPAPEATPAPDQLDAAGVWQVLLDAVREQSRTTQVLLSNATVSAVEGSILVLALPNAPLARSPQRSVERPATRRPAAPQPPDDGIPPPEPPDPEDAPPQAPMDDEATLAEAASMSRQQSSRRDPEEVALELLAEQLGARRIDER